MESKPKVEDSKAYLGAMQMEHGCHDPKSTKGHDGAEHHCQASQH
ncbi:hypothetical protein [Hafnia paralvei]|nr:hypothetical protein [Hafnia paralvei]MDX6843395.1 hypothetical protein [Hafnia paralvei]